MKKGVRKLIPLFIKFLKEIHMNRGECVELKMEKILCLNGVKEDMVHACTVLRYDENQECIYLLLQGGELTELSLDAIYTCKILGEDMQTECDGRIQARYCSEAGKILEFKIKNGFYKINLK